MSAAASLNRMVGALTRAQSQWRTGAQQAQAAPALTIALARQAGTPDSEVAHVLGRRLGWMVYDHELLEKIAQDRGLRIELLESVDERHGGWVREAIREAVAALAGCPSLSTSEYARHLVETVQSLSAHGHCVIVGRGAALILPSAKTLRVKLVAPLKWRVAALQQQGVQDAAEHVQEDDRQFALFVRENVGKDPQDVASYDLVLNTARWPVEDCVELIVAALGRLEGKTAGK